VTDPHPRPLPALYATARPPLYPCGPYGHVIRGLSSGRSSPEALGSPMGSAVPPGPRLLWPHLRLWLPLAALWIICDKPAPDGLLWAGCQRVPTLLCWSVPFVPSSVPRRTERVLLAVASPPTLAFAFLAQARHPLRHHRRFSGDRRHEAAKFTLCYGPKRLLAPHRPGRLRSSFHLPSHLQEMSSITTRANQPIPATGLSPVRPKQHYGLQARTPRTPVNPRGHVSSV